MMRAALREAGRWALCLVVLAGIWLVLIVAQSIADGP
jgi:hypothetical protein